MSAAAVVCVAAHMTVHMTRQDRQLGMSSKDEHVPGICIHGGVSIMVDYGQ
jgi:hypothetical protein